jgi:hypothetical protein
MARQRIQLEITGDSRSVERAFKNAGKAGSSFGQKMKSLGKVAAVGFGAIAVGVGLALKRGFSELAEAQKVAAQTNAVLRSTGGIANVTAKHVDALATSLSHMSGVDDELIASGSNMLLTFTNIRNGVRKQDKIFDQATATVLDMSVAMGKDIPSTAIMVGKALNDVTVNAKGTITGWSALRRVGVQVSASMMSQAAAFIKAGKPMEAQKLLLKELATEFGGSAKAFGTTMPGALGKMGNAIDEVMAAFAQGFLPLVLKVANALTKKLADPAFIARITKIGTLIGNNLYNALATVGTWLQGHWPQIQEGFRVTTVLVKGLAKVIGVLVAAFKKAAPIMALYFRVALIGPIRFALTLLSGLLEGFSKIPFVGDKFKGARDAVNAVREAIAAADKGLAGVQHGGAKKKGAGAARPGARVPTIPSPVPGFDPGRGKPKPQGKPHPGDVYIDGKRVGSIIIKRNQRQAKNNTASRRGPFAGQRLALG